MPGREPTVVRPGRRLGAAADSHAQPRETKAQGTANMTSADAGAKQTPAGTNTKLTLHPMALRRQLLLRSQRAQCQDASSVTLSQHCVRHKVAEKESQAAALAAAPGRPKHYCKVVPNKAGTRESQAALAAVLASCTHNRPSTVSVTWKLFLCRTRCISCTTVPRRATSLRSCNTSASNSPTRAAQVQFVFMVAMCCWTCADACCCGCACCDPCPGGWPGCNSHDDGETGKTGETDPGHGAAGAGKASVTAAAAAGRPGGGAACGPGGRAAGGPVCNV